MRHVMVDVETTGISKDHAAVIQISAVRFNLDPFEIDPQFFDMCLQIPPGRHWEEDTRRWWSTKQPVFESIWQRMQDPAFVMQQFAAWVRSGSSDPIFWSKPSHFDYAFLESYFRQFEVPNPFNFRYAENMSSWIRGRYFPTQAPEWDKILPFEGDEHNALDDVLHQIKALVTAYEDTK